MIPVTKTYMPPIEEYNVYLQQIWENRWLTNNGKFEQELTALEESLNMPYVTSMERIAEERGIVRGGASVMLVQPARLCRPLSEEFEQQVRELPIEALQELGEALFDFRSLPDLQAWLDAHQ